jgi:hypothetical protein
MQQNLLIEGYIPLGLTPGAPMQASPQALQSPPQASPQAPPQASQTPQRVSPQVLQSPIASTSLMEGRAIQSPGRSLLPTIQQAQSTGIQSNDLFNRMSPYRTPINTPTAQVLQPAITQNDPGWIDKVRQLKANQQAQRQVISDGFTPSDYFIPTSKTQQPEAMPSRLGNFRRFLPTPPPTESKVQSALSAMADMYEQQGMDPVEALGQAYKDARAKSDLFRKTLSQ